MTSLKKGPFFLFFFLVGCATVSEPPTLKSDEGLATHQSLEAEPIVQESTVIAPPVTPKDIYISAVGDIMLDGSARKVLSAQGYNYPFEKTLPYFADSQIVFGNLEGPLTDRGTPETDKTFVFRSPPEKVSAALKTAGFNVVSLANNHTLDYGAEGLAQTIEILDFVGISHSGAGRNLLAARQPALLKAHGQTIAVLSYSMTLPEVFFAGKNKPGTAFAHEAQVSADVRSARQQADIVLVSFHWGQERKTVLREYQTRLGHLAIDAGAHAVIGHHPHILQGVEKYKGGIILYSLGNFAFGSYSMSSARSAIARFHFRDAHLIDLELFPINVNNFEVQFQPLPLFGKQADSVIEEIRTLSAPLNTSVLNNNGVGVITLGVQAPL